MNKNRKTSHILNVFQYDHATGIIGLNGAPVSGYGLYLTTNINDGSVGIDSSASINALYLLKTGTKQFEISYDTSGATKIFRLLPYQSASFFQIGNPSNAANSNSDYVFISESVYGNVLIGPGIGNAVSNLTGATASIHKVQFNGAVFANNSIQATSFKITGGASTGFLKADGTVDAVTYLSGNQSITVSGDATGSGTTSIALTLANTAVTPGVYGSTTLVPVVTVDSKGRITSVTTAAISGSLTFTGDVTGSGTTGTSTAMTLAASGVTAGTYTKVTVDSKGRVTVGANASTTDISEGTNLYYTDARVGTYLTANSYATQSYVGTQVANLVAAAPATLDTLNELAAALGNDPSFATTVSTSIGTKVPQTRTLTINGTAYDLSADRAWTIVSMIYPSAGIAISTGTGWGTSITDNSANWNTAYGWGNHASGGYLTSATAATTYASLTGAYANPAFISSLAYSKITGVPAFLTSYTETDPYRVTSVAVSGTSTKTITLTRADASTVTTTWTDIDTDTNTYVTSAGFSGGTLTLTRNDAGTVTVSLDGRYYLATNPSGYITSSGSISGTAAYATQWGTPSGYANFSSTAISASVGWLFGTTGNGTYAPVSLASVATLLSLGSLAYSSATIPTNNNQLTNGAGYITSITSGNVTTALGFTPLSSSGSVTINGDLTVGVGNSSNIYMNDGDEGQRQIHCNSNRIGFLTQAGAWGAYCDDSGNWFANNLSGTNTGDQTNISGNAATAGGLAVHTDRNNEVNKIVRTDANGYIQAGWINTLSGDNGTSAITRIYASDDGYIRYYTPANFRQVLDVPTRTGGSASGSWSINAATATGQQSGAHFTLNTGGGGYGLVGVYNPDLHQGFYAMGPAYVLGAGGTLANFYGVSWSYDYSGRQLNTGYNLQHCMAVVNAGTVYTVIGQGIWTSGTIRANGAISTASTITASNFSGSSSGTNTGDQTNISGRAGSTLNWFATSHPNDYYLVNNWTGTHWHITSNHPSGVRVAYADTAGSAPANGGTSSNTNSVSSATGGGYTWTGINYFETNNGGSAVNNSNSAKLQAYSSGNNTAFMSFHRGGYYATNFGLDNDNVFRLGGWSAAANRWQLDMSGNMTVAGDVTAYSDARVKENIVTVDNALNKVLALRGVYYNRIDSDDKKTKIGVIAQETLPIVPEVVNQDNDGMFNVSYGNLAGLFIEAFKEQQKEIEELKTLIYGITR